MRWKSFLRFFLQAWRRTRVPIRKRPEQRFHRLSFDHLEEREMLSGTPPTIVQAGVLPVNGSTTSATPTLQIEFSDSMTNSALNPDNYVLLGSNGAPVPITSVSFVGGTTPVDDEVTLNYNTGNAGNVLEVDTYTLYVRGNDLFSATTGLAMSQPGQLFAANAGTNNLSIVNIPGTSGLGATSNYSVAFTSPTSALPNAVALADINGDGVPDLIVADEGTNQLEIFAGQSAAEGGGYNSTPTLTLALPATTTASTAESIAVGDFNGAMFSTGAPELDIAVANGNSDMVSVFLNTSTAVGVTSFGAATNYAVDADPVGITVGDFDDSGHLSLAVLASTAPTVIAPFTAATYRVDIWSGPGDGTFNTITKVGIGDTTPSLLVAPTSIAAGVFQAGALPTLVIGGGSGVEVLKNVSNNGVIGFNTQPLTGTTPIDSVAVGPLSAGGENSIAALTNANSVQVFENNGSGGFAAAYTQAVPNPTSGQIAIGSMDNGGDGDIVVSNGSASGAVTVVKNLSIGGTIVSVTRTANNPLVVDAPGNNLSTGKSVTITGDSLFGANVTDNAITILGDSVSSIVASSGAVTVTTSTSGALYGLVAGDTVTISGTGLADGTFTLTNVNVAGNTFTYTDGSVSGSATNVGTWSDASKFILNGTSGALAANGTGGTWAEVGGITAASETGGTGPIVITSPNNGLVSGDAISVQGIPGFSAADNTLSGVITNTEPPNNDPDVIFTNTTGLVNGMTVTISGVLGDTNANGTWTIFNVGPTSFQITEPAPGSGPTAYAGGGTWTVVGSNTITVLGSAVTQANVFATGVVTITAASTYGLSAATSDRVIITGSSLAVANGTWTIASVVGNTFTFNNAAATTVGATGTGGAWTSPDKFVLDGDDTAGASTGAGGTWTTQTSFSTGGQTNYSTGTAITGTVTNASPVITNLNATAGLSVGMSVTGAGIPAGATVASIVNSSTILLSANATAGGAAVALTFATTYSTGSDPVGVALGDTNSDGNLDVVTANFGANVNTVTLLLGNGNGTLQRSANFNLSSANTLEFVQVADLNDDGIPDVIVANNTGTNSAAITIYPGLGDGQYGAPVVINRPNNNYSFTAIGVGHFSNANGSSADFPDIVYLDSGDSSVGFLENTLTTPGQAITAASFTAVGETSVGNGVNGVDSLAVGDLTNNGLDDIVVGYAGGGGFHGHNPPGVAVLINTSTNASNFQFNSTQYDTGAAAAISSVAIGDFNNDGLPDFVAAVNNAPGQVIVNTNNGNGTFSAGSSYFTTVPNPVSVAVGDFTNNGFQDIVVASSSTSATNSGVAVLLNQLGTGFGTPIVTSVAPGTPLENVVVDDVNGDGVPDLLVSTAPISGSVSGTSASGSSPITIDTNSSITGLTAGMTVTVYGVQGDTAANGTWTIGTVTPGGGHNPNSFTLVGSTANAAYTSGGTWVIGNANDNVFLLLGNSTGAFSTPIPYEVAPAGATLPTPTYLAVTPTPLQPVTTFTSGGTLIQTDLVNNGNFNDRDLSGETGNLDGWQTYNDPTNPGSAGAWVGQTGSTSPLSDTAVPAPAGNYQAMLDEPNVEPIYNGMNPNAVASYSGGHVLYQDVTIPAGATAANFSMSLYINDTGLGVTGAGGYSDPSANPTLNFNTAAANQQVRVDIMAVQDITGATDPATGPIVITSPNNGLASGDQVTISGVEGDSAANGTWFVDVLTANTFALYGNQAFNGTTNSYVFSDPVAGNGTYTGGGNWTENFFSVNSTGAGADQVLEQLFQTYGASDASAPAGIPFITDSSTYSGVITANLAQFAGQTIRIRVAAVNNQGPLIVGVNNVQLNVTFPDSTAPTLSNLAVNNPSFVSGGVPYTNDPTITGTIGAPFGLGSIAYVAFDPTNGNFTSPSVTKTTQWDANGNFSYTLPNAAPGLNTIGVEVVDRAGNVYKTSFTFFLQTNSVTQWDPIGPEGINVSGQGVNYTNVSGRITATLADSTDPTGNTYLVGTPNGGIWRTTDGGNNWTSVTNSITYNNTPEPIAVGALAQAPADPNVMYAGTGVADDQLDDASGGIGILKSTNDGLTWTVIPGSVAVFSGARISSIVVDPNDPTGDMLFVAVASGGASGPGVYRSTDGGNTWSLITNPTANMYKTIAPFGTGPVTGGTMDSVTSMVINPYIAFGELIIGVGSINLAGAPAGGSATTDGVWMTTNAFTPTASQISWAQLVGDNTAGIANDSLPSQTVLGRVTVAVGTADSTDDKYIYVMIASTGTGAAPASVNYGSFSGLYKSSDNGLDWTKVMLEQDTGTGVPNTATQYVFSPINLLGEDADNAGSLVIDPTDPNAVYVGGSDYYNNSYINGIDVNHALVYVDTGDMISGTMFGGLNNGDDIEKYDQAAFQGNLYNPSPGAANDDYTGEGVYWYDMIEGQSGANGKLDLLPGEITSMSLDSQGRLLIGTVGGIWRGINEGFSYDFTSGDTGILTPGGHHATQFTTPGMSFTSVNGNLQISDMTSVAIDPAEADTFFTTQVDTGVATYSPANGWVSSGLTGPTTAAGVNLGIPTAVNILTATTSTGSVDLYRIWEYANGQALLPEVSFDGGETWQSISAVPSGVTAGLLPAFAINPTVIYSGNPAVAFNQLLFGSSDPVVTVDSSNTWNAIGTPAGIAAGAVPSAAAIAPSNDETYYIGDDEGEVWATTSGGGGSGSWTLAAGAASGLPTVSANSPIEGITVNPNNAANVFVMYGGTTSTGFHVYESTNTGASFTAINGPWGSTDAYSMVIDPTAALGAPNGKIYLATQVGVYVSINGGSSWSVLGQGMPNVPVVDLSYNPTLQTLAAATLGRGVFTINTSAISVIPTQTINENIASAPTNSGVIPFTVNDAGGVAYTITASSSNPNLIANGSIVIGGSGANRTLQFTPTLNAYNTPVNGQGGPGIGDWQGATAETITLTLTSGSGASAYTFQQKFSVAVDFVNNPPTVSSPGNQTIQVNQSEGPLAITVGDVETPAGDLTLQATSNNQALIPNANLVLGGSAPITAVTWNAGVATVTAANSFKAGQQVVIAGVTPSGYDGTFTIASANSTSFTYPLATYPGEPGGTAVITAASWAGNVATITAANTFSAGETVTITGMTPAGYNGANISIVSATPTQFTFDLGTNPGPGTVFGTAALVGATSIGTATTGSRTLTITPLADAITAATWNAGTATITTSNSAPDNFTAGQTVVIAGVTPSGYDGSFTILTANSTGFTYALANNPGGSGTAFGTASLIGVATITLAVTDGNGATTNNSFSVLVTSAVTLPFSDNFNSPANSVFVGPGWNTDVDPLARVNGQVRATAATTANDATLNGVSQANVALQEDVSVGGASGQYAGLIARYAGTGDTNMYIGEIYSTGSGYEALIERNVRGVWTLLSSAAIPTSLTAVSITAATWTAAAGANPAFATITAANNYTVGQTVVIAGMTPAGYNGTFKILSANSTSFTYALAKNPGTATTMGTASVTGDGTLYFDVTGDSLKLLYGPTGSTTPTLLAYAFDRSLTTGSVGFRMSGSPTGATTIDNFSAAPIPTPTSTSLASPGFSDNFSMPGTLYTNTAFTTQLDANWIESMGNFNDNGLAAVGNAAANSVATVSGVNATDVSVSGTVTLAVGQLGGLVARYTSAGNFYAARIYQVNANQVAAQLLQYINGVWAIIPGAVDLTVNSPANTAVNLTFQVEGPSLKLFMNGNLAAYAQSFALASGSVGIYSYGHASIAGFNAVSVTSGQSLTPTFTDNFNNTSPGYPSPANQLATQSWVELAGNFNVSTGNAVAQGAGANVASVVLSTPATDVSVSATVMTSAVGQAVGLIARASQTTDSYYLGRLYQTTEVINHVSTPVVVAAIYRVVNNAYTLIGTSEVVQNVPVGTQNDLVFQVEGPSLKLFLGGNLVAFGQDTVLTSGSVGMYAVGAGAAIQSGFSASAITSGTTLTPPPFTELFGEGNTGAPANSSANQLPTATWVEQAGNFSIVSGNSAVPQANGTNVASVVLTTPATDVSIAATVTLSANNQAAGLIARSNTATDSYYLGRIYQTTEVVNHVSEEVVVAAIYRVMNGVFTQVGAAQVVPNVAISANDNLTFNADGPSLKLFLGSTLVAYAQDTTLTSGSVGIYTYGPANGPAIQSGFTASPITHSQDLATASFSDTFSAGASTNYQLDPTNWEESAGNFSIASGTSAVAQSTGVNTAFVPLTAPAADVSVQASITLSAVGQYAGLTARVSATGSSYYVGRIGQINATTVQVAIYRVVNGAYTLLGSVVNITGVNTGATDALVFDVQGHSLKLFLNGNLATYAQDTSAAAIASGNVGMYTYGAATISGSGSGFTAGLITEGAALPFGDSLNNTNNNPAYPTQLNNADWLEQAGNFSVGGSGATGKAAVNLATLIDANPMPSSLALDVAFTAANQTAGLVFGYSGLGDKNYFYASITSTATAGTVLVNLYQNVNGVLTKLGTTVTVTGFAGGLNVSISGDQITVLTDGTNQQFQVTDAAFTNNGLIGFRATAGATVSKFSAS